MAKDEQIENNNGFANIAASLGLVNNRVDPRTHTAEARRLAEEKKFRELIEDPRVA